MNFRYVQVVGGEETWQPIKEDHFPLFVEKNKPAFATVLSVSQVVEPEMDREALNRLLYRGPLYFDWDAPDIADVIPQAVKLLKKLEGKGLDVDNCKLYATGGKGFHAEIPETAFMEKPDLRAEGVTGLHHIYKELAFELAVDTLDLNVYSGRKGRMWRQPNVLRTNGRYKVQISWEELQDMTVDKYVALTSTPRKELILSLPSYALGLGIMYDKAKQKVTQALARKKKAKVKTAFTKDLPTIQAMCAGQGFKPDAGFNNIALQMATIAHDLGWSENDLITNTTELVTLHQGNGDRYGSEAKREAELRRMFQYTDDNPCYEVAVGAIKAILVHSAPDLLGLPSTKEDIAKLIAEPESDSSEPGENDENTVILNKYGIYVPGEFGIRRISAIGFDKLTLLVSMQEGTILGLEADITINGVKVGHLPSSGIKDLNNTAGLNSLASKYGNAFLGSENQARGAYMRIVEKARKTGTTSFVTSKEGLDLVSIPGHEDKTLHEPFLVWADHDRVIAETRIENLGVALKFQGWPDTRGYFRSDLSQTPDLKAWLNQDDNKEKLRTAIQGLVSQQKSEYTAKVVGWLIACFYKAMFQKLYNRFPLLHVNGAAGSGKTSGLQALLRLFYYKTEPAMMSPSSSVFAIQCNIAGSASIPVVIDEYKPHVMKEGVHDQLKGTFREAYNGKMVSKGGGTAASDDYRSLHEVTLSAPIVFIAEAMEEESAVMERVILATVAPPAASQLSKQLAAFTSMVKNQETFSVVGAYIATQVVTRFSVEALEEEFEPILESAREKLLTQQEPAEGEEEVKVMARERSVFNYAVAEFGVVKFRRLIRGIFGEESFPELNNWHEKVYERLQDLQVATEPEWVKVFNSFSEMSHSEDLSFKLIKGKDYAVIQFGGEDCVELYLRSAYFKYRTMCKIASAKPLYPGEAGFAHGLKDCPALVVAGHSVSLNVPGGSHVFKVSELVRAGFRGFK